MGIPKMRSGFKYPFLFFWMVLNTLLFSCCTPPSLFEGNPAPSPNAQGLIQASDFRSTGDLIKDWYWLRDPNHTASAQWIFSNAPQGKDITLKFNVLATNKMDGSRGVNARFYLHYGVPHNAAGDGLILGRKEILLSNTFDPSGYLCQGMTTIFWYEFTQAPSTRDLWFMISRTDQQGQKLPIDVQTAYNKDSLVIDTR